MTETVPPAGYVPNATVHNVIVQDDGDVLIDGANISSFRAVNVKQPVSPLPVVNAITAGSTTVSGSGVSGSTVSSTFLNGQKASTTVSSSGQWRLMAPAGVTLDTGNSVSTTQTTPGSLPSPEVLSTVV
jgi:hypothetical protein